MGILGVRVSGWIEERTLAWKTRLAGWMTSWLKDGLETMLEDQEPGAIAAMSASLSKIRDDPRTPAEMRVFINKALQPGNILSVVIGYITSVIPFLFSLLTSGEPLGNLLKYSQDQAYRSARLDPVSAITAYRRDPLRFIKFLEDLRDQGWSEERMLALDKITQAFPSLQDVVRFYAREAFEPDMISRYGLMDELPPYEGTLFQKLGAPKEIADLYWIAHWEHASWNQVIEMLHRGQLTEEEVYQWYRVVEIPPYWREKLTAISWNVPTRVDVRRFYDLRTIDESRLREIYAAMGYHGKDLDDYVLWTKIYVDLPDLLARWKNGWITLDEVRDRLVADGMSAGAAEELLQTKVKSIEPTSTAEGKELTKSEIYKGVKQGVISYSEGLDLLMDLDYTRDQADYLLTTNVQVMTGSPEMYTDFKDMTQKYRQAAGLGGKPVPEELKNAGAEVVRLTKDVADLSRAVKEEEAKFADVEAASPELTSRLKELQVARNRALSELERVRVDYDALLARYRHGG